MYERVGEKNENNINGKTNHQNIHGPHTVFDIEPGDSANMSTFDAFELTQAAPHSVCWKEIASENMQSISVTRDTSHWDRSWLKDSA